MTRCRIAVVVAALAIAAACGPRGHAPATPRVEAAAPPAVALRRWPAPSWVPLRAANEPAFIEVPEWMYTWDGASHELQPHEQLLWKLRAPAMRWPVRPHVGSDALMLADRALELGDAVDAAAQYRALLARAPASARRYIELQLARAEVALGEVGAAEQRLRALLHVDDSITWPALHKLATTRVAFGEDDAATIYADLEPHVGDRREQLVQLLVGIAPRLEVADLFAALAKADRNPTFECLDALLRYDGAPPDGLPSWGVCPMPTAAPVRPAPSIEDQKQLIATESVLLHWASGVHDGQGKHGAWWLTMAEKAARAAVLGSDRDVARVASWLALAALHNAGIASASTGGFAYDPRIGVEITAALPAPYTDHARRLLRALQRDTRLAP